MAYRHDRSKIDNNQRMIVKALRKMGISVAVDHDDIICGYRRKNFWFEIKDPKHVSKKTGKLNAGAVKESQKALLANWKGHYSIIWSLEQILKEIGVK